MKPLKNHYKTLGIPPHANAATIKSAYRALVKHYHPDKGIADDTQFKEVAEAYYHLGHTQRRKIYDEALQLNGMLTASTRHFTYDAHWLLSQFEELYAHIKPLKRDEIHQEMVQAYLLYLISPIHKHLLESDNNILSQINERTLGIAKSLDYAVLQPLHEQISLQSEIFKNENWQSLLAQKRRTATLHKLMPLIILVLAAGIALTIFALSN